MNAGFTEAERTNFTKIIDSGFIDTFRAFNQEPGNHSWWSQFNDCRARNIGWRVDYFVASEALRSSLKKAWIEPEIMGSDHCPVGLEIKLA
jgi:exodeoxyribonuclease-3